MPEITRPSGLRLSLPDTYRVSTPEIDPAIRPIDAMRLRRHGISETRTDRVRMPEGAEPLIESVAIIEALEKQEMQLIDSIELEPKIESTLPTGLRSSNAPDVPEKQSIPFNLDVEASEEAVILVEQDGIYSWVIPDGRANISVPSTRRTGGRDVPNNLSIRRVSFTIDVHAGSTTEHRSDRRGFFTDLIYSKVKVFVLKFVARIAVGLTMKFLERNVERGIVVIDSENSDRWRRVEDMSAIQLPNDRIPRVLLLIHGTFSNTVGSFGALSSTPWGRSFLSGALRNYDLVIGFDHSTLSEDPMANAVDLLRRLQRGNWTHAPKVDSIAYSRGAIVLRSLIEHLLPATNWSARFEKAVFIGGTNGGTALAEPDNWHTLVDLYTNLAAGAFRLLGMMPQATVPVNILSGVIQGLGALVKYMATEAVSEGGVPGLAAMEPDGEFITKLNKHRADQPTQEKTWFYAITSQFEPNISNGNHEPKELPHRFALLLADGFVDRLMNGATNDVVVDTTSMTKFSPQGDLLLRDEYNFGVTSHAYHLNYFTLSIISLSLK